MKTVKTKFILFSLLTMTVLSMLMTSCEQEAILTDGIINNVESRQSYIIMFKTDDEKSSNLSQQLKGKSREEVIEITQRMQRNFKAEANSIVQRTGMTSERIKGYYESIGGINIMLTPDEAAVFSKDPLVKHIDVDKKIEANLPDAETQTTERTTKSGDILSVFNLHHGGYGLNGSHKSTWIWILDTGIDLDHPELNVITDDFYAKSFTGQPTPDDCKGHGTHVAGIAAAKKNGQGIVGMSEGAKLVPLQILFTNDQCDDDYTSISIIVEALNHLYSRSIPGDVVNLSVGGPETISNSLKTAMDRLNDKGVYIVMAAGNSTVDASTFSPAGYNNTHAITVGNITRNYKLHSTSNYGAATIDYVTIGDRVYSTNANGGYGRRTGTSMSAAAVSGIIHATAGNPMPGRLVYDMGEYYVEASLWQ